jgi:hypothetical protein
MERRNDDELTATEEQTADEAIRRLLARYGQPTSVAPPPDLTARVLARLPDKPPAAAALAEQQQQRRGRVLGGMLLCGLLLSLILGSWGVLVNSSGPAELLGGVTSTVGQFVLVLVLAAKPLVHAILSPGVTLLLPGLLLIVAATWLWWQLVQQTPLAPPLEV